MKVAKGIRKKEETSEVKVETFMIAVADFCYEVSNNLPLTFISTLPFYNVDV